MEKKIDVLYAEDDPLTAEMVKGVLEEHEFSVRIACDGIQAWDIFRYNPPDLLLLDLEMPGKDGMELVRLVRERNDRIPVIFYSSHMDVRKELDIIKLGADDCIYKRGTTDLLLEKLRSIYYRISRDEKNPHVYFLSESTKYNAVVGLLLINSKKVMLKPMDARLLQLLCVKMHEIAGNEYLMQGLWGKFRGENKENALRKSVKHLRDVLEADTSLLISNSYGEGYVLTSNEFPRNGSEHNINPG